MVSHTTLAGPSPSILRDVEPGGERFLVTQPQGAEVFETTQPQLLLAVNWLTELRERLGAGEDR